MLRQQVAKAIAALREAAARAAWTQWGAIFTLPASRRPARSIVDPEALLLGSFALSDHEPRLAGVVRLWARYESRLLSVQRAKNLASRFPSAVRQRLGEFARVAMTDGGDLRWRSVAGRSAGSTANHRDRQATPVLEGGPPLMLRLRLGMGVGIKPDVIAHLIGIAGGRAPVQLIARATAYHGRAVRRALEELAAAGFVESRPTVPVSYRVDARKWAELLAIDPDEPPPWRSWAALYSFVAALDEWSRTLPADSDFVLASEARGILLAHGPALDGAVQLPMLERYRGEALLDPFVEGLKSCAEFVEAVV
ncbi:MAG: hypothetical protein ACREJ4_05055 [Candidatus Methylomirabilaceae bacterium]